MKKLIVTLLTVSMIAATGSTHAMFKNFLSNYYWSQTSLQQKQVLVKQQFPMPALPPHRIPNYDLSKYNNLCNDFVITKDIMQLNKNDLNKWRMLAPVAFLATGSPLFGWPFVFSWCGGYGSASDRYKKSKKELANLEQEIKDLIYIPKHELRISDDIQ